MEKCAQVSIPNLDHVAKVRLANLSIIRDIYDSVAELLELESRDNKYFGLTYAESENGRQVWAVLDGSIGSPRFHADAVEHYVFAVRRFPARPPADMSRGGLELLYDAMNLQRRLNPFGIRYHDDLHRRLAAYQMQATYGNYTPGDHAPGYSLRLPLLPLDFHSDGSRRREAEAKIDQFHRDIGTLTKSRAVIEYLNAAYSADCYSQVLFRARRLGEKHLLGFGPNGISWYSWSPVESSFVREKLMIWEELRYEDLSIERCRHQGWSAMSIADPREVYFCQNDDANAMKALFAEYLDSLWIHEASDEEYLDIDDRGVGDVAVQDVEVEDVKEEVEEVEDVKEEVEDDKEEVEEVEDVKEEVEEVEDEEQHEEPGRQPEGVLDKKEEDAKKDKVKDVKLRFCYDVGEEEGPKDEEQYDELYHADHESDQEPNDDVEPYNGGRYDGERYDQVL